ncbi:uncharacterized protein BP5553_10353 [Venustampulla echinocandica]|uniref:Uncharacterized protein n=1 Tax=Venustampulla echinocandica TaxID=2656787 RepID=A0A370TA04_9HELO|nr:uncharacterized protein BP5553_10353 [Venustampulla echinocandica]RDL30475.1 hypothetical protein BP5553_10353 [Venustampulla echinocandica]
MLWEPICNTTSVDAQFNYCAQPDPAVAFSVFFGLTFFAHVLQSFTFRKAFCWVVVMAALWQFVGFACRVYATKNQTVNSSGAAANLLVLLAPLWVNAFVYMVFGRIVFYFLPEQKVAGIKAVNMARCAFIIQATGGVLTQNDDSKMIKLGLRLYTVGIGVQEAFVLMFMGLAIRFHWKMAHGFGVIERGDGWKKLLYTTYATLALITIRIIYRLCEFASGDVNSTLSTTESYFYALDATPMCVALFLWNIIHPGSILQGPESLFPKKIKLTRAQKRFAKEEKKNGKAALKLEERPGRTERKSRRHRHSHRESDGIDMTYQSHREMV